LNYNKSFSDTFQFDALAITYYDYTAAGSEVTAKGFNANQLNLIDNIEEEVFKMSFVLTHLEIE
jgi:iron complex outermembrane receptor protein